MSCLNICMKYKANFHNLKGGHYGQGHKRCKFCDLFLNCNGNRCPCCNHKLRLRRRKRNK